MTRRRNSSNSNLPRNLCSKLNYYDPMLALPWPRQQEIPDVCLEGGNPVRHGPTGNRVCPDLHSSQPTVSRAAGRQNNGPQNRRTPVPAVPDARLHIVDVSDAYYRPTDYKHLRHSADAHIALASTSTLFERVALLAPNRFRSAMPPDSTFLVTGIPVPA
jgi:hypothetical protein